MDAVKMFMITEHTHTRTHAPYKQRNLSSARQRKQIIKGNKKRTIKDPFPMRKERTKAFLPFIAAATAAAPDWQAVFMVIAYP